MSKSFIKIIVLISIFRLSLDYGYWKFVYPLFGYSGFTFELSMRNMAISWIAVLIIFIVIYIRRKSPLIYIYFLIYVVTIVPTTSYYALSGSSQASFWTTIAVFLFILLFLPYPKKINNSKIEAKNKDKIINFSVIFCLANLAYLIYLTKGNYNFSLEDVYDFRAENADNYSGIFGYINNWSTKVLIPFLIAVSLTSRNKMMLFFSIALNIAFFAFTGHKSILLPIILCLFLSIAFKDHIKGYHFERFFVLCLFGLLFFSLIGIGLFLLTGDIVFASTFFRRSFFVPVFLNDIYFDMFEDFYKPVYWSNSLLSSYISYPYEGQSITKVVGAYLNVPDMSGNTGFIGSGYMQSRYWGVALYSLIIVGINYYLVKISHRVEPLVFNAVLLMPFLTAFSSSDLPTTMLTHGLLTAIFILYLYSGILKFRS